MNGDELIVGIDLGTTASAISYMNVYGKPEIIPNREGDRTTPSVIFFEADGMPIVGYGRRAVAVNPGDAEGHFVLAWALGNTALTQILKRPVTCAPTCRARSNVSASSRDTRVAFT